MDRTGGFERVDLGVDTVDGRNHPPVEGTVLCPIIYWVLYIPGGCLGYLNHQQY